jgi:hypothetical protein
MIAGDFAKLLRRGIGSSWSTWTPSTPNGANIRGKDLLLPLT